MEAVITDIHMTQDTDNWTQMKKDFPISISACVVIFKAIYNAIPPFRRRWSDKCTVGEIQNVEAISTDIHMTQDTDVCFQRAVHYVGFLFWLAGTLAQYTTNIQWAVQITDANQTHISGDERSFTFGQVTALVTLATSFYKIVTLCLGKTCAPS